VGNEGEGIFGPGTASTAQDLASDPEIYCDPDHDARAGGSAERVPESVVQSSQTEQQASGNWLTSRSSNRSSN